MAGSGKRRKVRIELFDVIKAVTIFLVIVGHTTGNLETPMFRRMLYAFHMPLFFFLGGLSTRPAVLRTRREWIGFLRKNILALVVPYLVWGLIYAPFSYTKLPHFLYASWKSLVDLGTLTSLWYLSAFFMARILVQLVIWLLDRLKAANLKVMCGVCAVPLMTAGFLLPRLENGYPWCLDVSLVAAGYILLGIALRSQVLVLAQGKVSLLVTVCLLSLGLFLGGTLLRGDSLYLCLMCNADYGNVFWFLLNSVTGSLLVMSACMLLVRMAREGFRPFSTSVITYIGQRTLGIFLLHKNMLQELILPWIRSWMHAPQLVTALLGSCIALVASMLLCMLIERYVPQLLGQFPRYEQS